MTTRLRPDYEVTVTNLTKGWSFTLTQGDEEGALPAVLIDPLILRWSWPAGGYPGATLDPEEVQLNLSCATAADVPDLDPGDLFTVAAMRPTDTDPIPWFEFIGRAADPEIPPRLRNNSRHIVAIALVDPIADLANTPLPIGPKSPFPELQDMGPFPGGNQTDYSGMTVNRTRDICTQASVVVQTENWDHLFPFVELGHFGNVIHDALTPAGQSVLDLFIAMVSGRPTSPTTSYDTRHSVLRSILTDDLEALVAALPSGHLVEICGPVDESHPVAYAWQVLSINTTPAPPAYSLAVVGSLLTTTLDVDAYDNPVRLTLNARHIRTDSTAWRKAAAAIPNTIIVENELSDKTSVVVDEASVSRFGKAVRRVPTTDGPYTGSDFTGTDLSDRYVRQVYLPRSAPSTRDWRPDRFSVRLDEMTDEEVDLYAPMLYPHRPKPADPDRLLFSDLARPVVLLNIDSDAQLSSPRGLAGVLAGGEFVIAGGRLTFTGQLLPFNLRPDEANTGGTLTWQDLKDNHPTVAYRGGALDLDPTLTYADFRLIGP